MGFKMPRIVGIVALVTAGIALLFQIIAVAATGWIKEDGFEFGLWKVCLSGQCIEYDSDVPDWLYVTRTLGLLGLCFIACALVVGILSMFIDNRFLPALACLLAIKAGLCVLISFVVFVGNAEAGSFLSYCFALSVVACVLCIVSSVFFVMSGSSGTVSP